MEFKKGLRFTLQHRKVRVLNRTVSGKVVKLDCSVSYYDGEATNVTYHESDMQRQYDEGHLKIEA